MAATLSTGDITKPAATAGPTGSSTPGVQSSASSSTSGTKAQAGQALQPAATSAAPVAQPVTGVVDQSSKPLDSTLTKTAQPATDAAAQVANPVVTISTQVAQTVNRATQPTAGAVSQVAKPVVGTVVQVTQPVGATINHLTEPVGAVIDTVSNGLAGFEGGAPPLARQVSPSPDPDTTSAAYGGDGGQNGMPAAFRDPYAPPAASTSDTETDAAALSVLLKPVVSDTTGLSYVLLPPHLVTTSNPRSRSGPENSGGADTPPWLTWCFMAQSLCWPAPPMTAALAMPELLLALYRWESAPWLGGRAPPSTPGTVPSPPA